MGQIKGLSFENKNTPIIKNFVLVYEAEGLKPLFQELMCWNYYLGESLMICKQQVLKVFLHKKIWNKMGLKGLKNLCDSNNKTFTEAIKEINRVKASFDVQELTLKSVKKIFSELKSAAKSYGYFDMAYLEEAYKKSTKDKFLENRLKKIEKTKDEVKEVFNEIFFTKNSCWDVLLRALSKKFSIPKDDLEFYLEKELFDLFLGKQISSDEINRRKKVYAFKPEFLRGSEAEDFISNFDSLNFEGNESLIKGIISNVGCGVVKGRVKIININYENFNETNKKIQEMNQGDILVSRTTDPSLIRACKKSSAIITDVGGMLSHAAIVTRELNIPGIVGTQNASKILKDGDLVEVDTNNGYVKIIKKSKKYCVLKSLRYAQCVALVPEQGL